MSFSELDMDAGLVAVFRQASREDGIPVLLITRSSKSLWLIMPFVTPADGWHPRSDQARWLAVHGTVHNHVTAPFFPHWEVPRAWLELLLRRLLERYRRCYVIQGAHSDAFAPASWNARVSEARVAHWGRHVLRYELLTEVDVTGVRVSPRRNAR